jgi:TonB family protein
LVATAVIAWSLTVAPRAFAQGDAVEPPHALEPPSAVYPPNLTKRVEADVLLIVTVEKDGSVTDAVVEISGGTDFDDAAIDAARRAKFKPATHNGAPIRARVKVGFHFAPPAPPASPPPVDPTRKPDANRPDANKPAENKPGDATQKPGDPSPDAKKDDSEGDAVQADEVTVLGHAIAPSRGASDFHIDIGELHTVPRKTATELLTLAPGILLTNEGGEGHAEQIFLRGFDAREGQDIEINVDGVPINESGNLHGSGYADAHFLIPELVESLRVVEGPFEPRQGNYAVAGSAEYQLGLPDRGLTAKYQIGSFNSHRLALLWGPPGESTRTFGGVELASTAGYGDNRDAKHASAIGQYEGKLGASGSFRLIGTAYAAQYHEAGIVREDDYDAGRIGFFGTYDPNQGGSSNRYSIAATLDSKVGDTRFEQQVFVVERSMRLRENFTGFLLDPQTPLQSPHPQRGDLIDLNMDEQTIGARGSARLGGDLFGERQELELGYVARGDNVAGQQARLEAATGHPYHVDRDLSSHLGDIGLYVDADFHPTSWITLRGGLRAELFAYDVTDNCAVTTVAHPSKTNPPGDQSCLSQQDFGAHREPFQRASSASTAFLPRASVLLGPVSSFRFTASVGEGVRSIDPSFVAQDVATPFARLVAFEGGVMYSRTFSAFALSARSLVFQTRVDKDLIFSETQGRNVLGGGSKRTGWIGAARVTADHVDLATNVTLVKSTLDDTGLLIPYVPDVVVRTDGTVFGDLPFKLGERKVHASVGTGVTFVGHRPLPFGQRSDALFTIDMAGTLGAPITKTSSGEVGLAVTNLLDTTYRLSELNFASSFQPDRPPSLVPQRAFTAGPPRQITATFAVHFGGG